MRRLYLISGHVWAFCAAGWFVIADVLELVGLAAGLWLACAAMAVYFWAKAVRF